MNMIEPEIIFLIPAKRKGGMVSTPTRMAKNVVPQKNATQNKARYSFVFKQWVYSELSYECGYYLHIFHHLVRRKLFQDVMMRTKLRNLLVQLNKIAFSFCFFYG